jgi:hypothetical protein
VSVAARASALAALALVGGVGTVYAPVPTFTAVAVLFPASVRDNLDCPRVDGQRTGSGALAEDGGITAITTIRTGDEQAKDTKPQSSSP